MAPRRRRNQRGFTLIELMVALVLFALVTGGLMSVAVTMTTGFRDQEVTISTESASRSAMDFLSEAIRGASPGVPSMAITQIHNCTVGAFTVQNDQTVVGLPNKSDTLTLVMPHGAVVTSVATAAYTGTTTLNVASGTGLADGDYVLITDFNTGHLAKIVSGGGTTALTLDTIGGGLCTSTIPGTGYPIGSVVMRALRARFFVQLLAGETVPMLMMDPDAEGPEPAEPIAEGIENMEIVVGVDGNPVDGVLGVESGAANGDEWLGNVAGEVTYGVQTGVRAIRISLVARTTKEATGVNTYVLPALEDRAANVATDNFRRRILTSTIEVRNLGGSP